MCGIAGFTHAKWLPDPDRIHTAVASFIHRGPDQQDVFQSNFVSMGATRLKIIDLHSGDQPIVSENGDTVIVFNGEIYNHADLPMNYSWVSYVSSQPACASTAPIAREHIAVRTEWSTPLAGV